MINSIFENLFNSASKDDLDKRRKELGVKFFDDQRVVLPARASEGWPEERGSILSVEHCGGGGMYLVQVDAKYLSGYGGDDGTREVHEDDIVDEIEFDKRP